MKRIFVLITICIMLLLPGCKDNTQKGSEEPAPTYSSLEFESIEKLIECVKSDGETYVSDSGVQGIEIENYPEIIRLKESGKIPILVDKDGNNVLENIGRADYINIIGRYKYMESRLSTDLIEWHANINEQFAFIKLYFAEEEFLSDVTEPDFYQYCEYKGWYAEEWFEPVNRVDETIQLADREVKATYKEEYGKVTKITFFCDEYLIVISFTGEGISSDYFSDITVGHVSIE